MTFSALLDACVLVPSTLRDLLLQLGTTSAYRPLWSERIESEVERTILRYRESRGYDPQESRSYVTRLRRQMNEALPDARIEGWESFEDAVPIGPDPNDRHVVAAAVAGRADVIVTLNLKDFCEAVLPNGVVVQHPDEFLLDLLDLNPALVMDSLEEVAKRSGRKGPKWTIQDLLERLDEQPLSGFVAAVKDSVGSADAAT